MCALGTQSTRLADIWHADHLRCQLIPPQELRHGIVKPGEDLVTLHPPSLLHTLAGSEQLDQDGSTFACKVSATLSIDGLMLDAGNLMRFASAAGR